MAQADKLAIVRLPSGFVSTNALNATTGVDFTNDDITGHVMVVQANRYNGAYQQQDRRVYAVAGAGCGPANIGGEVFCTALLDGAAERWDRGAFSGYASNPTIPSGITIATANNSI